MTFPLEIPDVLRRQLPPGTGVLLGLSGGVSRGRENPNCFNYDQLFFLAEDPKETTDLARRPEHAGKLRAMKELLARELKRFDDRPYGEFIPGGDAMSIGTFDDVLATMKAEAAKGSPKKQKARKRKK